MEVRFAFKNRPGSEVQSGWSSLNELMKFQQRDLYGKEGSRVEDAVSVDEVPTTHRFDVIYQTSLSTWNVPVGPPPGHKAIPRRTAHSLLCIRSIEHRARRC